MSSSQPVSRKRPAPGTSPAPNQPLGSMATYSSNPGSQLSNDQFLQWGQNPSSTAINSALFVDAYNPATITSSQDVVPVPATAASNQLMRRQPSNQIVSRQRSFEPAPAVYHDQTALTTGDSAAWAESLDELYRRAAVAKREAQTKRKQIPPFVQKLSR